MKTDREQGFIGLVILIIIALALLKYYLDFDVFAAAGSPHGQETIGYTARVVRVIWSYISTPVTFVWNQIILPLIKVAWTAFEHLLTSSANVQTGSTDIFH